MTEKFEPNHFTSSGAKELDKADNLNHFREKFHFPKMESGEKVVYLCGNSLGLQPKSAEEAVAKEMEDWKKYGVDGHFMARNPWKEYHALLTEPLAEILGAKPVEVVAMDTLTNNLNSILISFYRPEGKRRKIMIEGKAFPSDIYAVESHIRLHGLNPEECLIKLFPKDGEAYLRTDDILTAIKEAGEELGTVMFGAVNYYSGEFMDLEAITKAAHAVGAYAGFDLAHAIGNLPLNLHENEVDFAVWCSYKYLNAGPGATAGLFVHEKHAYSFDIPRLAGWWGHDTKKRFLMDPDFEPMPGAEGWQNSNPAILPMACKKASLDIFAEAGISNLRDKSLRLTAYLEQMLINIGDASIEIITPTDPERRGAQLSIRVKDADKSLYDTITNEGVICDWREPDVIRVAPVPLYNSFYDVFRFTEILKKVLKD
jgi:kynureninase